ncbi:aldolase [Neobacillus cucumis]|nr:aldolase [Neobacillus cucumis]
MVEVANEIIYKAFGFSIKSKIPFPELLVDDNKNIGSTDIEVVLKDLSNFWLELSDAKSRLVANETLVMFKVLDVAIFLIEEGKRITVSPINEYKEDVIRLYLLGSCMGAILMQRGIFPLHGSAVSINGKAYGIIGDSGAGKSTLASAFLRNGYQLITDDVIGVYFSENEPMVIPSYPQQKLWQESLDKFGIKNKEFRPIYQRETKFAIPIKNQFSSKPLPLAGLFELSLTQNEEIEIKKIEGLSRLQTLLIHTYRNLLIKNLGLTNWHFIKSTNIVNKINMYQLRRPQNTFTANELVSLIIGCINKENGK